MPRNNTTRRKQRGGNTANLLRGLMNKPEANRSANEKRLLEKAREIQHLSNTLNSKLTNEAKLLKRYSFNKNSAAKQFGIQTAKNQMRTYAGSSLQKKLAAANGTIAKLEYLLKEINKD